jgi:hypothetical protein
MTTDRAALLAEAYSRNILPPEQKAAYEEAISRGLIEGPVKKTDLMNETTAVVGGVNRGVANTLGAPVDIVNAGLKWAQGQGQDGEASIIPGIGPIARLLPDASATPVGGSEWWKNRQGNVIDVGNAAIGNGDAPDGRAIIDTQADTRLGRIGSRVGEELGSMAVPMAGALALAPRVGKTAETVRQSLAGTGTGDRLAQGLMSVGSGVGAGVAKEVAPDSQLAELAGALLGGGVTAGGLYGGGTVANVAAPFLSQGAREGAAGEVIRQSYTAPEDYAKHLIGQGIDPKVAARQAEVMKQQALDVDLGTALTEVVPGSKLTSAMTTQNPGLASLERTMRATNGPEFATADAARAEAQRAAIQGQAPQGPGADAVQAMAQAEKDAIEQQGAARVAGAQQQLDTVSGALGQGADPLVAGRTIRGELAGARGTAKANESALWQGLEKNPDLALSIQSGREAAQRMIGEIGPYAAPPQGDVAGILEAASNLPDTIRYADLQQLRSRALQATRDLKTSGNAVDLRRVEEVVRGLDEDIAKAAGGAEVPAAMPEIAAPRQATSATAAPQSSGTVYTPSGMKVDTQFEVVDLAGPNAPVVSHTQDFTANPNFPAELQPRDRGRAASEAQVTKMAGDLNPERLGSGGVGEGAPIIGPDGIVESGNGRTLAVQRAHQAGGKKSQEYKAWLAAQGYDTTGMQAPMLVRRRTSEMAPEERAAFVQEANAGPGLKMSAVEQAAADAGRVTDDVLDLYRGGALDGPENRDLARAFVGKMGAGEVGALAAKDGTLSLEGAKRMASAMLSKAFGGDSAVVSRLLETGDEGIKALGRALTDAAPGIARLKAAIARGDVSADFDPTKPLLDAVRVVEQARKAGQPISGILAQVDAFNPLHPMTETFLKAAYGDNLKRASYGKASEALKTYLDEAGRQTGGDMFGGGPSAGDVWGAARRKAAGVAEEAPPAPVATESAPAPQTSPTIVPDGLTANFGPDEAAAYKAARQATAERKGTFDSGAPGAVLKKVGNGGRDGEFAMPVEQVAGRLFNAGKASTADVTEFLKAAGSRPAAVQALQDFAVADLKRVATNADGTINAAKWRNWMDAHAAALRPFPELAAKMRTVAQANDLVRQAGDEAAAAIQAFGKSAGGTMLAKDADVAIASVLGSGNRTEGLTQLVKLAKGDPEKLGQLRRAVIDHFQQSIENAAVDAAGNAVMSQAKATGFLNKYSTALERSGLFTDDHLRALRAVEEDMARMTYINTVGRAIGSNTFQNFSAGAVINQVLLGAGLPEAVKPLIETLMRPVSWAYQVPDREVRRLILEAVADPKMMRTLAGKATPDRMNWVGQMLKRRLAATSVEGAAQTLPDEPEEKRAAAGR